MSARDAVSLDLFASVGHPPGGLNDGLLAPSWAPIADIPVRQVGELPLAAVWRLWVGSTSYAKAEDELVRLLCEMAT